MSSQSRRNRKSGLLPLPLVLFFDLLAIGGGLLVFALFHHVLVFSTGSEPIAIATPTPAAQVVAEVTEEEAEAEPTPEPIPGDFSLSFPEQFTDGEVIADDNSYRSGNVALYFNTVTQENLIYHTVEVYVRDVHYLRAGFANGASYSSTQFCEDIAKANNAIAALSGDCYLARQEGVVVRNGVLYRDTPNEDVGVIWSDGTMECIPAEEYDVQTLIDGGAWQAWGFGPALMSNGQAIAEFDHALRRANPRSAIGYVEPGHYFLVMVEGRTAASSGMTFEQLSELFASLGCVEAYNLDGGQSAGICWNGELVNQPFYRAISDIIFVSDSLEGES